MFKYRRRAKQLIDFDSLSWGKCHPADIDGIMEFDGKKLILLEFKAKGRDADMGQRSLLKHLADNWKSDRNGRDAIVIYAEHEQYDPDEDVDSGMAIVKEVYWNGKYIDYSGHNRTVRSVIENYAEKEIKQRTKEDKCLSLKC